MSPGIDAMSAEMLTYSQNDAVTQLHILFNSIWKDQCVPKDWKKSLMVRMPKKGDLNQWDNLSGHILALRTKQNLPQDSHW